MSQSPKQWLNEFKISIITNNLYKCEKLVASFPQSFTCKEEIEEAMALTKEAISTFKLAQNDVGSELAKLKTAKKYLS